jgi:hypothetical protein
MQEKKNELFAAGGENAERRGSCRGALWGWREGSVGPRRTGYSLKT